MAGRKRFSRLNCTDHWYIYKEWSHCLGHLGCDNDHWSIHFHRSTIHPSRGQAWENKQDWTDRSYTHVLPSLCWALRRRRWSKWMNRGMNKPSLKQTLEGQSIELVKHVLSPPVQHWIAPTTASAMGRAKTQKRSSFFARERMSSLTEQDEEREEQTWGHSNQCHRLICDMINSRKNPRRKHLFARLINKRDREKESLHPTEGCREREKVPSLSPVLREQQTITYWWQISSSSSSWWKTFVSLLELRERGNRTKEKIIIVMGKKKETETENCCRRAKDSNEVWERERDLVSRRRNQ